MLTRKLSWDWVERHCASFAADNVRLNYDAIVPVARGGMIPAVMLSHLMRIPIVGMIEAASYGEKKVPGPVSIRFPEIKAAFYSTILIVEDIVDTGATLDAIAEHPLFGFCTVFTLVDKQKRKYRQNVRSANIMRPGDADVWITFPWEPSDE